jgi:hypothetical protein
MHTLSIQAEWAIEEYTKIVFRFVWFKPPSKPVTAEKIITGYIRGVAAILDRSVKGAIFCQVKISPACAHSVDFITWGNQK